MEQEKKTKDEGINAKFDWNSSFFRQCERIDTSMSPGEFKKNIDLLWAKLSPYIDDQYTVDRKKAFAKISEVAEMYSKTGAFTTEINSLVWNTLLADYSALYELAYRQKVLPQRVIPKKKIGVTKTEKDNKNIGV